MKEKGIFLSLFGFYVLLNMGRQVTHVQMSQMDKGRMVARMRCNYDVFFNILEGLSFFKRLVQSLVGKGSFGSTYYV